ncbi:hypothetical protein ABK040_005322 [Willaertia magna]
MLSNNAISNYSLINEAPEEILANIFSYLDLKSISNCFYTCSKWYHSMTHLPICYPFNSTASRGILPQVYKEVLHLDSFREYNSFWLNVNESISIDFHCNGNKTFVGGSLHSLLERLIEQVDENELQDNDDRFEFKENIASAVVGGYSGALGFQTLKQIMSAIHSNNSPTLPYPLLGSPTNLTPSTLPNNQAFPNDKLSTSSASSTITSNNSELQQQEEEQPTTFEVFSFQRSFFKTFESFLSKSNFLKMSFIHFLDLDRKQVELTRRLLEEGELLNNNNKEEKENMERTIEECRRKIIKLLNVLNMFIHFCIRMDPKDQENDDLIVLQFCQFIDNYLINENVTYNVLYPFKFLKGIQLKHSLYKKLINLEKKKQEFIIVNPLKSITNLTDTIKSTNIYTIGKKALAQQLTILEFLHYKDLRCFEFIGFPWRKCPSKCPAIVLLNKHFERIAQWVATEIVMPKTVQERSNAMKFFIDLCLEELIELKNYQTLFAISAGLMSASVFRLKLTKEDAGDDYFDKLESLRELVSLRANFRVLRTVLESIKSEDTIPYIGVFLSDLKNLYDYSNQLKQYSVKEKMLEESGVTCVNWFIIQREYHIIHQLMCWKEKCMETYYKKFEKDEFIQYCIENSFLRGAKSFEELYQTSLKREPRQNNNQ